MEQNKKTVLIDSLDNLKEDMENIESIKQSLLDNNRNKLNISISINKVAIQPNDIEYLIYNLNLIPILKDFTTYKQLAIDTKIKNIGLTYIKTKKDDK